MSLKSKLCHGTVLTLSTVIIPVSDQMTQTNCHQSQWQQNSGKISTRRTILVWRESSRLPTHWDWWHCTSNHPEPHLMSRVAEMSRVIVTNSTGVTCWQNQQPNPTSMNLSGSGTNENDVCNISFWVFEFNSLWVWKLFALQMGKHYLLRTFIGPTSAGPLH